MILYDFSSFVVARPATFFQIPMALMAGGLAVSLPAVLLRTDTCRPISCAAQQNADVPSYRHVHLLGILR
jgi:hypothetical protein